jgi:SAM-dependent methyltransferase
MPFLLRALGKPQGKRVLDIACGTGRHSIELASRGAIVTGLDISSSMLERATHLSEACGVKTDFIRGNMRDLESVKAGSFDLILCLGNSLALSASFTELEQTLRRIHSLLSEEGHFIVQILNFEEVRRSGFRFFPARGGQTSDGKTILFFRFFDHSETDRTSDLVLLAFVEGDAQWRFHSSVQSVLNLDGEFMNAALRKAGFTDILFFGDYNETEFSVGTSRNLVVRALR